MAAIEVHCTHCRHAMAVDAKIAREPVRCANCNELFRVQRKRRSAKQTTESSVDSGTTNSSTSDKAESEGGPAADASELLPKPLSQLKSSTEPSNHRSSKSPSSIGSKSDIHPAMNKALQLLPPRFTVPSEVAEEVATQLMSEQPSGIDLRIDTEVTRIEHAGQKVEVRSMTREEKQRRKSWRVAIVFTLGVIVLVSVFMLLLKQSGT